MQVPPLPPSLMDPPPPPQQPPLSAAAATILLNNHHPDSSVESSPRCRAGAEPWPDHDHPLLPHVPGAKLRLMISYGGHIMPRPHDKSLSYVGGDTRMVAVDRHTSLKDLCARLSRTLLHGRPFTLKYQLPNEDLDNLITVATDDDLDNMIEEYDRLSSKPPPPPPPSSSPSRLRVFLFFCKADTALSMGSLLDDAKSETWFVDALNNSGILSRGVSDSAAVDECLVNLDDGVPPASGGSSNDLEGNAAAAAAVAVVGDGNKQGNKHLGDVHSVPGSPLVLENNSLSYGSSSSSSSLANVPPIRVRVDENGDSRLQLVMEEQFAQMTFGKQDYGYTISSSVAAAASVPSILAPVTVVTTTSTCDNLGNVVSDEDRSLDHQGAPDGFRKPPLPLQLVQPRTISGHFGLPSPDSIASDSSIASANSYPKAVYYQEQVQASHVDNKAPPLPNIKSEIISDHSHGLQREQVKDSGYTLPQQMDQNQQLHQKQQPQFVYIHHPASTGQVPMSPYYPVYAPPSTPSHQQLHHPIGQQQQQCPVYVMPAGPTQPYNMTMQSNIADPNAVVASTRPLIPQGAAAYEDGTPLFHPTKSATPTLPDVAPNVYKAPVASSPAFVQIPPNQFQQQYVCMPQNIHHPTQPTAIAPSATTNYGYEYGGPTQQDQVYYTQQQSSAPQPPQYQSMTPAAAAAALSDVSNQFPLDNFQQPSRTTTQPV